MSSPCIGGFDYSPDDKDIIDHVGSKLDSFTENMISGELAKYKIRSLDREDDSISATAPPNHSRSTDVIPLSFMKKINNNPKSIYQIPSKDPDFGGIGLLESLCYYGRFSDGMFSFGSPDKENKDQWTDLAQARQYFYAAVGKPIYGIDKSISSTKSQSDPYFKLLNQWSEIIPKDMAKRKDESVQKIHEELVANPLDENLDDYWLTLIAFSGYGSHRTTPTRAQPSTVNEDKKAYYACSSMHLKKYNVRSGFKNYGATAYFTLNYAIAWIELSDGRKYYPDSLDSTTTKEWQHAKWHWKVSLSVAVFLIDDICHSRFRECNGYFRAMNETLDVKHPLYVLLRPFLYGSVYNNLVLNELMSSDHSLFARAFAFTYDSFCQLMRDSMENKRKNAKDSNGYRWKLAHKRATLKSPLVPPEIYPLHGHLGAHWNDTLAFVEKYFKQFYDDNELLVRDKKLEKFYTKVKEYLGIGGNHRFKDFNVINVVAQCLMNSTVWSHHLHGSVSFEYSINPDFTGLKISGNYSKQMSIVHYVEWILMVIASKGWRKSNLINDKFGGWSNRKWASARNDNKIQKFVEEYFGDLLQARQSKINEENPIAKFNACNPRFCSISIKL